MKVLKHLQEKVKQLKLENLHLKRGRKREDVRGDDSTSNGSSNGQVRKDRLYDRIYDRIYGQNRYSWIERSVTENMPSVCCRIY